MHSFPDFTCPACLYSPAAKRGILITAGEVILSHVLSTALYGRSLHGKAEAPDLALNNPTEIHTALGFGLLYAAVLYAAAWLSNYAGSRGLYTVALVSGLTDVDAITLSSLRLFEQGKLAQSQVVTAVALAFIANMVFKFGLILFIGGGMLARKTAAGMLSIVLGVAAGWLVL